MHLVGFISIGLLVLALMHGYAWKRLVLDTRLPPRGRRVATLALVLLFLALPGSLALLRDVPLSARIGLTTTAFAWLGLVFYLVLFLAAADVLRLARRVTRRAPPAPPPEPSGLSRRELLARATAGVVVAGAGGTALAGWTQREEITTPEVPVRLARLPRQLDGVRLVQLSDLHLGLSLDRRFLREAVQRANALRPDAVVITGDLVDGSVDSLGPELAPLADLRSRWGTFFITGNHEYYSGAEEWVAFLRAAGIRVLINERMGLGDAVRFDLAGVTDYSSGYRVPGHAPNLPAALAGRDPSRELVLLAHQPRHVREAAQHDVGLQLSGHTHGGQMWPFGALVGLVQPYVSGLHRHGDRTQIYVSRGTGFWGPPMRVAAPAEIPCIVLTT